MIETTPQERLALTTIALLIITGTAARGMALTSSGEGVTFTTEAADTLSDGTGTELREMVAVKVAVEAQRSAPLAADERIDPNTATAVQLDRLPGVGPALAARIVEHRAENGRFPDTEALLEVQGIGAGLLERIRGSLTLPERRPGGGADRLPNLNGATEEELMGISGIGPALARRIIEHRQTEGRFSEWTELEQVSGIGPKLRSRLESAASLGP